jgi:ethanolamine utilization protein EutQ (cupin superfamily)
MIEMTTVIVDFTKQKMFADTQSTVEISSTYWENIISFLTRHSRTKLLEAKQTTKVLKLKDGLLFGAAGSCSLIERVRKSLLNDKGLPEIYDDEKVEFVTLIDKGNGVSMGYLYKTKHGFWKNTWSREEIKGNELHYIVIGSGKDYTLGALSTGVSPSEALVATSRVDPYTNSIVDCVGF